MNTLKHNPSPPSRILTTCNLPGATETKHCEKKKLKGALVIYDIGLMHNMNINNSGNFPGGALAIYMRGGGGYVRAS